MQVCVLCDETSRCLFASADKDRLSTSVSQIDGLACRHIKNFVVIWPKASSTQTSLAELYTETPLIKHTLILMPGTLEASVSLPVLSITGTLNISDSVCVYVCKGFNDHRFTRGDSYIVSTDCNIDAYLTMGCLVCSTYKLSSKLWPGTLQEKQKH